MMMMMMMTTMYTYSVMPAVRHDAYNPTADDAAVTSSHLAVRTACNNLRKISRFGWGRNSKKGSVTLRYSGSPIITHCQSGGDRYRNGGEISFLFGRRFALAANYSSKPIPASFQ